MFTGNEMFWKTRWAASIEGSNTADRTLITYKETHYNAPIDPEDPPTWTGAWPIRGSARRPTAADPANSLSGQEFVINAGTSNMTVPSQYSKLRIWQNTGVAKLAGGSGT